MPRGVVSRRLFRWWDCRMPRLRRVESEFCLRLALAGIYTYLSAFPYRKKKCRLSDIKGQELVRRAIKVTAASRYNVLMIGPSGS